MNSHHKTGNSEYTENTTPKAGVYAAPLPTMLDNIAEHVNTKSGKNYRKK